MEAAKDIGSPSLPPFLSKTYDMVDNPDTNAVVSWGLENSSFVVWSPPEFAKDLLPNYFKHNNFSSFVRQLNTYGFRKVDPDRWEFANEGFVRGQKHLLKSISRRKSSQVNTNSSSLSQHRRSQGSPVRASVEVGKFGLDKEIERLRRDKNVLMQELVKLRRQQQSSDGQLLAYMQRLEIVEQRQQQIVSFLAKAMQNDEFLSLISNKDERRRVVVTSGTKKRRLPKKHDDDHAAGDHGDYHAPTTGEGQMIRHRSQVKEGTTKTMLSKILELEADSVLDCDVSSDSASSPVSVLCKPPSLDIAAPHTPTSRVMFGEQPPATQIPCFSSTKLGPIDMRRPSTDVSTVVPPADPLSNVGMLTASSVPMGTVVTATGFPALREVEMPFVDTVTPIAELPSPLFDMAEAVGGHHQVAATVDVDFAAIPEGLKEYPVLGQDILAEDDVPLPLSETTGYSPPAWEEFLAAIPGAHVEAVESFLAEIDDVGMELDHEKSLNMADLTEQMSLLSADL